MQKTFLKKHIKITTYTALISLHFFSGVMANDDLLDEKNLHNFVGYFYCTPESTEENNRNLLGAGWNFGNFIAKEVYNHIGSKILPEKYFAKQKTHDELNYLIQYLSGSNITHVGMIFSDKNDENHWSIYHATVSKGMCLENWNAFTERYPGKIGYKLAIFDGERPDPEKVNQVINNYLGKPFNHGKMLLGALGLNQQTGPDPGGLMCVELAVQVGRDLGIILPGAPAGNFFPGNLVNDEGSPLLASNVEFTEMFPEK